MSPRWAGVPAGMASIGELADAVLTNLQDGDDPMSLCRCGHLAAQHMGADRFCLDRGPAGVDVCMCGRFDALS